MVLDTYIFKNFLKRTMETNISVILKKKKRKNESFCLEGQYLFQLDKKQSILSSLSTFQSSSLKHLRTHCVPIASWLVGLITDTNFVAKEHDSYSNLYLRRKQFTPEFVYRYFAKRKFYHFETVHITHLVWRSLNRMLGIHKSQSA